MNKRPGYCHGFTLIELLVVIIIITLLIGILLPVLGSARDTARQVRELAAARSLMQGYTAYHTDRDGHLMPGYDTTAKGRGLEGQTLGTPVADRYPWRISRYLRYRMQGSVFVNENAWFLSNRSRDELGSNWTYQVSLHPSFGINAYYVGGYYTGDDYLYPAVKRAHRVIDPSNLMVFASAYTTDAALEASGASWPHGQYVPGWYQVSPPPGAMAQAKTPGDSGMVHRRWDGKAVVGLFDGHAELWGPDQFDDRRHWSNDAAQLDDPNWSP